MFCNSPVHFPQQFLHRDFLCLLWAPSTVFLQFEQSWQACWEHQQKFSQCSWRMQRDKCTQQNVNAGAPSPQSMGLMMKQNSWCVKSAFRIASQSHSTPEWTCVLPLETSVGSVFKCPLLCFETPGWLLVISCTLKSDVDQRSLEKERPSLSITKLCNLGAAPQMSLEHSRCTPTGLLKICHLVVGNLNAISQQIRSWLRQKFNVQLVGTCFIAPLNGMRTSSESGQAFSPMMKHLSGGLSTHCQSSMQLLNALMSLVIPGPMVPKWMNCRFASTKAWTLTPCCW